MKKKFYSTDNKNIKPVVVYNADLDKLKILKENKKKAGVYR